jgi:hypothetical protein
MDDFDERIAALASSPDPAATFDALATPGGSKPPPPASSEPHSSDSTTGPRLA